MVDICGNIVHKVELMIDNCGNIVPKVELI